jgi:hypothetical protein
MISLTTRLHLMKVGDTLYTSQADTTVQSLLTKFIKPERPRFRVRTTRMRAIPPAGADLTQIEDITRVERIS